MQSNAIRVERLSQHDENSVTIHGALHKHIATLAPGAGPSSAGTRDIRAALRAVRRPRSLRARHGSRARGAKLGPTPGARVPMRVFPPSRHRAAVLAERASALREFATISERKLWLALSGGKAGARFRRQVPLAGRYIADFLAPALRLVVEVDGPIHALKQRADARRDEKLRRLGYHVLRIPAEVVLREPEAAAALVRAEVERLR